MIGNLIPFITNQHPSWISVKLKMHQQFEHHSTNSQWLHREFFHVNYVSQQQSSPSALLEHVLGNAGCQVHFEPSVYCTAALIPATVAQVFWFQRVGGPLKGLKNGTPAEAPERRCFLFLPLNTQQFCFL